MRHRLGMSQRAFADMLGISHRILTDYERSVRSVPSHVLERLVERVRLSAGIEVDLSGLFAGYAGSERDDIEHFADRLNHMIAYGERLLDAASRREAGVAAKLSKGWQVAQKLSRQSPPLKQGEDE